MSMMMKKLFSIVVLLLVSAVALSAPQYTKITYIHPDGLGNPAVGTDEQGNLEWRIEYYPFGAEYSNSEVRRESDVSFAGKSCSEKYGLCYFGGRWYDPDIGRFTGIDPMPVNPEDWRTFNRYSYGFNNPYSYVDPDGNLPFLIPLAVFMAKEIAAEYASRATDGATDFLSVRRLGSKAIKAGIRAAKGSATNRGGSVGAMRRNTFEPSPKHGASARNTSKGVASRGPKDGQHALDTSVQVKSTSPRRVGVDKANGEITVFDQTSNGVFHGHVRSFKDLTSQQQNALKNAGLVDKKGKF